MRNKAGQACLLFFAGWSQALASPEPAAQKGIQFNRDIRAILSDNCYACHGPDKNKRKAELRLDTREGLFGEIRGHAPVVPGKLEASELWRRVTTSDAEDRMPPAKSGKALSSDQIATLRRWIEEGAAWEGHWAYLKLARPPVPGPETEAGAEAFVKSPIDRFILAKLREKGLEPSREADGVTLLRRLSFDLTGLPPSPEAVAAFRLDPASSYEELVEKLLASPAYGERMAIYWLDLVRYADTTGIHGDNHRDVAPYRDYVIKAFNDNKPFDLFTIEQIAGDLLPDPTLEQKVASGYNRMNMTTSEGGAQAKEYIAKYAADRVRNASALWLGATMGCCECHDHKFDPYTTRDFYRFAAFFADVKEEAVALPGPPFPVPSPEQAAELARLDAEVASVKKALEAQTPELDAAQASWETGAMEQLSKLPALDPWRSIGPFTAPSFDQAYDNAYEPEKEIELSKTYEDGKLKWIEHADWEDGKVHELSGENAATYLYRTVRSEKVMPVSASLGSDDGIRVWLNGKQLLDHKVSRAVAPDQEKLTLNLEPGENKLLLKIVNGAAGYGFYFKLVSAGAPEAIAAILKAPSSDRSEKQRAELSAYYRGIAPLLDPSRKKLGDLEKEKAQADSAVPRTLISISVEPRVVRILRRGNWLDESGDIVTPAAPAFLKRSDETERRETRLDLARWIVSPENPLTARVLVNRLWKLFFGAGLARTVDDLGSQGAWPTHPELLDWLAAELIESGWDIKHMVKLMVHSGAYRQSSSAPPGSPGRERDPYNYWLSRQSQFRLDAEMIRDNALAVSGLLVRKVGGSSVKPYQPAGYWDYLNFPIRTYQHDHGESQYRRGLYTYWCRTFLHPSFLAFDAPTREECTVDRPRSNTPIQALVLLNDPTYLEAARVFAERVIREGGTGASDRLRWAFRRALSRNPEPAEEEVLSKLYEKHREEYSADNKAATELASVGEWPVPKDLDAADLAAWASVARAIFNLHEMITRS